MRTTPPTCDALLALASADAPVEAFSEALDALDVGDADLACLAEGDVAVDYLDRVRASLDASPPAPEPPPLPRPVLGTLQVAAEEALVDTVLANGLRVTVVADPRLTEAAVVHRVDVGSAHEGPEEEGLAHLVEHMLFEGTAEHSGDVWDAFLYDLGATANATTTWDETTYYTTVPPEGLVELLDLEAERFRAPLIDEELLAIERQVVADELRLRGGIDPSARLVARIRARLMPQHPYGRPIGGTEDSVLGQSRDNVEAFHARHYVASNMHVVIVGPQDADEVLAVVSARYADLGRGEPTPAVASVELVERRTRVREPGTSERLVGVVWELPGFETCPEDEEGREPCIQGYVGDELAVALLESAGADYIGELLSQETLLHTPVTIASWRGEGGGFLAVFAPRRRAASIAAWNVAWTSCTTCGACAGVYVKPPLRKNPSGRLVRRMATQGSRVWITDEAIERARTELLMAEYATAWDATARALAVADRVSHGLGPSDSLHTWVGSLTEQDVRRRYGQVIRDDGEVIRVR